MAQIKEAEQNKPIPVIDIDISRPIDVKKAIEQLGGSPEMFYMMLEKFEDMSLLECLTNLAKDVNEQDFLKMKNDAHSLKGASGYICASRVYYACYYIQEHYVFGRYKEMLEYYPTLVEASLEVRIYSRQLLADF